MKTKIFIIELVVITVIVASFAYAAPDNPGPRGPRGGAFRGPQGPAGMALIAPEQGPRGPRFRGGNTPRFRSPADPNAINRPGQGRHGMRGALGQGPVRRGQRGPLMQRPGRGGAGGPLVGRGPARLGRQLELTPEQTEQIQAIMQANRDETQLANQAVRITHQALALATKNGNEAEIIAAGKEAGDALIQQALQKAAVTKQINDILTPEQLTKLEELKTQTRQRGQQLQRRQRQGEGPAPMAPRGGRGARLGRPRPDEIQ